MLSLYCDGEIMPATQVTDEMIQAGLKEIELQWFASLPEFIRVGSVEAVRTIRCLEAESARILRRKRRSEESTERANRYQERARHIRNWLPDIIDAEQQAKGLQTFLRNLAQMQFRQRRIEDIRVI
jgi:hypothetical protein